MKNWIMLVLLFGMAFAVTVDEVEPNDDDSTANAFNLGGGVNAVFDSTETTWMDVFVFTVNEFGVVTVTVDAGDGLSVAPGVWKDGSNYMLPASVWSDYGASVSDTDYLFPGDYYVRVSGSSDYGAEESINYVVLTTFQGSPGVLEVEPNNEMEGANAYALGDEMTGVWSKEDFDTGSQTSKDYFEVYLEPGVYRLHVDYGEAVCLGGQLLKADGGRLMQVDEDTQPRMWYWMEGELSKSADYEITEAGTYYVYMETEGCAESEGDEFNYLLLPYEFTLVKSGEIGETPGETAPEPGPEEEIEPVVPDEGGVPPAPECENDFDCPGITEVCVDNVCVDVMEAECGGKICAEDEFLNSECECVPLGGGVVGPCCGTVFALLAAVGFAIRKG